jgi:hypothetical protein
MSASSSRFWLRALLRSSFLFSFLYFEYGEDGCRPITLLRPRVRDADQRPKEYMFSSVSK